MGGPDPIRCKCLKGTEPFLESEMLQKALKGQNDILWRGTLGRVWLLHDSQNTGIIVL